MIRLLFIPGLTARSGVASVGWHRIGVHGSKMANDHIPIRRHTISQLETYEVTQEDLQSIRRECGNVGLDFQVSEFAFTVAIAFLIAIKTTKVESDRTFIVFVVLVIFGFGLGVVFGIRWYRNRGSLDDIFRRIEARQIGPAGDEEHQLKPSQVAQLPAVAAPASNSDTKQETGAKASGT